MAAKKRADSISDKKGATKAAASVKKTTASKASTVAARPRVAAKAKPAAKKPVASAKAKPAAPKAVGSTKAKPAVTKKPVATSIKKVVTKKETAKSRTQKKSVTTRASVVKAVSKTKAAPKRKPRPQKTQPSAKKLPIAQITPAQLPPPAVLKHGKTAADASQKAKEKFTNKELEQFRDRLLEARSKLTTQVVTMRQNALTRHDEFNHEEDGTDAFDRLFTLDRAGGMQTTIQQINNALRAIDEQNYGVCESCGCLIERARLEALPFVKNCVTCQSNLERQSSNRAARPRRVVP